MYFPTDCMCMFIYVILINKKCGPYNNKVNIYIYSYVTYNMYIFLFNKKNFATNTF